MEIIGTIAMLKNPARLNHSLVSMFIFWALE